MARMTQTEIVSSLAETSGLKKTDVKDSRWIQKLHMLGLLSGSFLPSEQTVRIRNLSRHRGSLVEQAAKELLVSGIDCEIIDIQSLLPFDINHDIVKSITNTNRLLVIDEDVPGGASAYIMQQILDDQNAYDYLDSKPQTLTAKSHRPAYGTDGDYFSKPSVEDIYEKVYAMMSEVNPKKYPSLY